MGFNRSEFSFKMLPIIELTILNSNFFNLDLFSIKKLAQKVKKYQKIQLFRQPLTFQGMILVSCTWQIK